MKAHRSFSAASRSFWVARYVICLASVLLFACDDDGAKTQASSSAGSDQTEGGQTARQQRQAGGETADGTGGGQNTVGGDQETWVVKAPCRYAIRTRWRGWGA